MKKALNKIDFHTFGKKIAEEILETLGKKTKLLFVDNLLQEWESIKSDDHQYMLGSDVLRVAESMKLDTRFIKSTIK